MSRRARGSSSQIYSLTLAGCLVVTPWDAPEQLPLRVVGTKASMRLPTDAGAARSAVGTSAAPPASVRYERQSDIRLSRTRSTAHDSCEPSGAVCALQ